MNQNMAYPMSKKLRLEDKIEFKKFKHLIENLKKGEIPNRKKKNQTSLIDFIVTYYLNSNKHASSISDGISFWSTTILAKNEYSLLKRVISEQIDFERQKGYLESTISIIDIGTGNGHAISHIIKMILEKHEFDKINLTIIDENFSLLEEAHSYCKELFKDKVNIIPLHGKIEEILSSEFFSNNDKFTFANFASVLHEISYYKKKKILKRIKNIAKKIFITEIEGKHDIIYEEKEVLLSAFSFYSYLIHDALVHKDDLRYINCIYDFLIPELLNILLQKKEYRGNFHLPLVEWSNIYTDLGLSFQNILETKNEYGVKLSYFVSCVSSDKKLIKQKSAPESTFIKS